MDHGLDINIYDNETGAARSADTLSGGETFIAALSIALVTPTNLFSPICSRACIAFCNVSWSREPNPSSINSASIWTPLAVYILVGK